MTDEVSENLQLRDYNPSVDEAFLYATWLNCYKMESYFAKKIKKDIFYTNHTAIIDDILERDGTHITIACLKAEPNIILGWAVWEDQDVPVIHFVFVKSEFRKFGIGKKMMEQTRIDFLPFHFTHWTYTVNELIRNFPNVSYDPYRVFYQYQGEV